ncbi:MAG: hypothetical protein ACRDSZ_18475 [Pseudonocardiaceae bacterium]
MTRTATLSWVGLVDGLTTEGVLFEPWRAAFLAVPLEMFIPEVIWRDAGDDLVPPACTGGRSTVSYAALS